MSEAADNGRITYTVKELLGKVDAKLDAIVEKLDSKADEREFEELKVRVDLIEKEASEIRVVATALSAEKTTRFTRAEKVGGALYLVVTLTLNVLALAPDLIG